MADVVGIGAASAVGIQAADEQGVDASLTDAAMQPDPEPTTAGNALTQETFNQIASGGASGRAAEIIAEAKRWLGTPYKWGGTGPLGVDCSGFTQAVYKKFGVNLPRISYQQSSSGARRSIAEAQPGDLVFWDSSSRNPGADHVAIYLGNGQVIHAPKPGDKVKISQIWGNPWAASMGG